MSSIPAYLYNLSYYGFDSVLRLCVTSRSRRVPSRGHVPERDRRYVTVGGSRESYPEQHGGLGRRRDETLGSSQPIVHEYGGITGRYSSAGPSTSTGSGSGRALAIGYPGPRGGDSARGVGAPGRKARRASRRRSPSSKT
nr:MAG: putative 15 kDa protein [Tomato fruit blotch virus]